jgi:hypothetical protein
MEAIQRQVQFASAFCSKQQAGPLGSDVPAGYAAKQLRAAHMAPNPWTALPRTETIFWCFGDPQYPNGFFVDSSGVRSVAPPLTSQGETCHRTSTSVTCSGPFSQVTP